MAVDPELRTLQIDIPSRPDSLVQLSLLMADEDMNVAAAARLIEGDMALAASVLKAVNSSLYGLKGRVQSVQQAITYLGMREVAAITFEMGLRAAFPPAPELEPIWQRAAQRGLLMGRLASTMGSMPGRRTRPGCSRSAARRCCSAMRPTITARCCAQRATTPNWPDARTRRLRRQPRCTRRGAVRDLGARRLPRWPACATMSRCAERRAARSQTRRAICALSVLVHALMLAPETLDEVVQRIAPQADIDPTLALRVRASVQRTAARRRRRATPG